MSNENLIMTLAKVLIAAAWADGKVSNEEVNSLKDLLFQLPEMTASDWAEIDIYIETPINLSERTRLVMELQEAMRSRSDKALALARSRAFEGGAPNQRTLPLCPPQAQQIRYVRSPFVFHTPCSSSRKVFTASRWWLADARQGGGPGGLHAFIRSPEVGLRASPNFSPAFCSGRR